MQLPATSLPWIESPLFSELLPQRGLSPADEELARAFRRDGFLIVRTDLASGVDLDRLESAVRARYDHEANRLQDAWESSPDVRALAVQPEILRILGMLYGRAAVPFQTLNFLSGTEQETHSDFIHFASLPARYMAACWIALEDVSLDQGPLHYYPGSHRLPELDYDDLGINEERLFPDKPYVGDFSWKNPRTWAKYGEYEKLIARIARAEGLERQELEVKRGEALIWSSNLMHGGSPIRRKGSTRRSQVTHYFFEDTVPVTPMWSSPKAGEWFVRAPTDLRTLTPMKRSFDGVPVHFVPGRQKGRHRIELRPEGVPQDDPQARAYLERYPDIAKSQWGESLLSARAHFEQFGRREGRSF
jgi:hypothetical protein